MGKDIVTELAESCVELAAQDRSAGGLDSLSDEELIERRAEMEVEEYQEVTGESLPEGVSEEVSKEALRMFREDGGSF